MQTIDDEPFIDFDKYDESDSDYTRGNKKHSYYTDTKYYHYSYWDGEHAAWLSTTLECTYRVTHGTFSPTEDSDWDFRGYTDLVSWDVLSVENNEGDEVDPEKVLTEGQFLEYTSSLSDFIGD